MKFYISFILIGLLFALLSLYFPSLRWRTRQANKSIRHAEKTKRRTEDAKRYADALVELRKTQARQQKKAKVLRLQSEDHEMHDLYFGGNEVSQTIVYANKTDYSSMKDFLTMALAFLDEEDDYWTTEYRDLDYYPLNADYWRSDVHKLPDINEKSWKTSGSDRKGQYLIIIVEPIINFMGYDGWDTYVYLFETETDYVFYRWYCSG